MEPPCYGGEHKLLGRIIPEACAVNPEQTKD
jgi:hypothetical protein